MMMIGHLIDCAGVLKNKAGHSTLRATQPEHAPSEENVKQNDAKKIRLTIKEMLGEWLQTKIEMSTR